MPDEWYDLVTAGTRLTQGDLVSDCPLVGWKQEAPKGPDGSELRPLVEAHQADVVVLTQACDLEHEKVENILLCAHLSISEFKRMWEESECEQLRNPTPKAWRKLCEHIADGNIWNHTMIEGFKDEAFPMERRIIDFREVFTVPRVFLESFLRTRGTDRLRLRPPYREHVSQAFARFFMRVGLPLAINKDWP